ncbi:growth hormone secretagogue receptor type 1-like [Tubulanus polymorphus]|uniref:growth hormone secretagogue receptor type 1-like n=1 Tax=Tubulanus polymorphus TaxID=672921 RepID=UPI003DA5B107
MRAANSAVNDRSTGDIADRKRTVTMLVVSAVLFLLFWGPIRIWNFLDYNALLPDSVIVFRGGYYDIKAGLIGFGGLNAALNPLIYPIFNRQYRKACKQLMLCRKKHGSE